MLENVEEKVTALTKLADLVGKQTLVMWCIVTTFTTGYLFIDGRNTERELNKAMISEIKASQDKLVEKMEETQNRVNNQLPRLDTLINNASQTIKDIKKDKK